jgi:hypothetical protein
LDAFALLPSEIEPDGLEPVEPELEGVVPELGEGE